MKYYLSVFLALGLFFHSSVSRCQSYNCSLIPDSLSKKAEAVVRDCSIQIELQSVQKAVQKVTKVVTVLKPKGARYGNFKCYYDLFRSISDIRISIYNCNGDIVRKIKQSEIYDHSFSDDVTLLSDDRVKEFTCNMNQYPYTVSLEYTIEADGYMNLPAFQPIEGYGLAVQHSSYIIRSFNNASFKYREMDFTGRNCIAQHMPSESSWEVTGLKALEKEPYSVDIVYLAPVVLVSPVHFKYAGTEGEFSSWASYGTWISNLLDGRGEIPEKTRVHIHEITDTISSEYGKAKMLYEYLQSKVRYVGIQVGLGGHQPIAAEKVEKLGYGDCKALSNYYISLLHEVGISAIYTVTSLEDEDSFFLEDFPANLYFNHVVVCIPMKQDTLWAECTNNFLPFGYMGKESMGKASLLITKQGTKVVRIPFVREESSSLRRSVVLQVLPGGEAKMKLNTCFYGAFLEDGLAQSVNSKQEQEKFLYSALNMNDIIIDHFDYSYQKQVPMNVGLEASITCNRFASLSGNRMFIPLFPGPSSLSVPNRVDERISPFEIAELTNEHDTITTIVPQGYSIESLPRSFTVSGKFGNYSLSIQEKSGIITIVSSRQIYRGTYSPADYGSYRDFISTIVKAENQKVVLKQAG